MGRSPCCEKVGLKKGPWTPEEDQKLLAHIDRHGDGSWHALPAKAGLQRCGKSCRLRWINYLKPDIKRGKFSLQEEATMIQLHALLGNRWSVIAAYLPKRTDNEIKNYWNTHVKKKLTKMGIDHVTHKPKSGTAASACSGWGLNHMAQWETTRLEAEARLVRQSRLQLATMTPSEPQHEPRQVLFEGYGRADCNVRDVGRVTVGCDVLEKGIIGNSCSGSFENNDEDWDNNIMSLVDAYDFPLDDEIDVSPHFML